jgi:hypothetical protein
MADALSLLLSFAFFVACVGGVALLLRLMRGHL